MHRTLRHCLKDCTFSVLKTPKPYRTHNVKLDQFDLLYLALMLDFIKFEKMPEDSAGFGENMENGQFLTEPGRTCRHFVKFYEIQHECWIEQIKLIKFHIMGSVGFGVFNIEKSAIF
jgi:hypothetical protein